MKFQLQIRSKDKEIKVFKPIRIKNLLNTTATISICNIKTLVKQLCYVLTQTKIKLRLRNETAPLTLHLLLQK